MAANFFKRGTVIDGRGLGRRGGGGLVGSAGGGGSFRYLENFDRGGGFISVFA